MSVGASRFMGKPLDFVQLKRDVSAAIAHGGGRG